MSNIIVKPTTPVKLKSQVDLSYLYNTSWTSSSNSDFNDYRQTSLSIRRFPVGMFLINNSTACMIQAMVYLDNTGNSSYYRKSWFLTLRSITPTGVSANESAIILINFPGIIYHPTKGISKTPTWIDAFRVGTDKLVVIAHVPISWATSSHFNNIDDYLPTFKRVRYVYNITETEITLDSTQDNYAPANPEFEDIVEWVELNENGTTGFTGKSHPKQILKINDYKYVSLRHFFRNGYIGSTTSKCQIKVVEFSSDGLATLVNSSSYTLTYNNLATSSSFDLDLVDRVAPNKIMIQGYNRFYNYDENRYDYVSSRLIFDIASTVTLEEQEDVKVNPTAPVDSRVYEGTIKFTYPANHYAYPNFRNIVYDENTNLFIEGSRFYSYSNKTFTLVSTSASSAIANTNNNAVIDNRYSFSIPYDEYRKAIFGISVTRYGSSFKTLQLYSFNVVDFQSKEIVSLLRNTTTAGPVGGTIKNCIQYMNVRSDMNSYLLRSKTSFVHGAPMHLFLDKHFVHNVIRLNTDDTTSMPEYYFGFLKIKQ